MADRRKPQQPPNLLMRKVMEAWEDPEGRVRLFFWTNVLAFLMLALGVVLIVLVIGGWLDVG